MKKSKNYLDFVPTLNPLHTWEEKEGIITVHMVHQGFHHMIAQKLFRAPRISHITLDAFGSFLWKRIDGVRSVEDLAEELKSGFGEEAEPLYDRLVQYMRILQNNRFVLFVQKEKI